MNICSGQNELRSVSGYNCPPDCLDHTKMGHSHLSTSITYSPYIDIGGFPPPASKQRIVLTKYVPDRNSPITGPAEV